MSIILLVYNKQSGPFLPLLTSATDHSERFFLKSLSMDVLFGNIDRKIRQGFPLGINTLTCLFTSGVWGRGRAHTPLSPLSGRGVGEGGLGGSPHPTLPPFREGSGGGGFGREPTPHCRVIYSYIHFPFT